MLRRVPGALRPYQACRQVVQMRWEQALRRQAGRRDEFGVDVKQRLHGVRWAVRLWIQEERVVRMVSVFWMSFPWRVKVILREDGGSIWMF